MKRIKHILVLMVITLVGTTAVAQEKELTEEQKAQMEAQLEVYIEKLNLSDSQQPNFEEITKRYGKQLMVLKESSKGRLSKYKEFKSISKDRNKEMQALLSEEQYTTYLATQEEMQQKMKEQRNN
ncbi:hypothetical protein [Croceitalea rosinachiae]|uniref:LTXXQ motif family protein n=1 Tax=Croceitalea rosinachiae TaxID=3075596 RepID=A0ABU3A806_9FLAO|nr:hypothetical protein [Croceitalea sp. F388]MDT0605945.1 hypothetical protein [Croceitalea sp. F388]